jgi:hypothetical protein
MATTVRAKEKNVHLIEAGLDMKKLWDEDDCLLGYCAV